MMCRVLGPLVRHTSCADNLKSRSIEYGPLSMSLNYLFLKEVLIHSLLNTTEAITGFKIMQDLGMN